MRWALLLGLAACSTQDNLGNHVFGDARWSVSIGSTGEDRATAIAVDAQGNVIVAGTCDGVVSFGATKTACNGSFITQRARDDGHEQWTTILRGTAARPRAAVQKKARTKTMTARGGRMGTPYQSEAASSFIEILA